jgi:hypothetical protein
MINQNLLKSKIALSGLSAKEVAEKIGIPYQNFSKRKAGKIEFNAKEIKAIKEVLNLTNDDVAEIFLV